MYELETLMEQHFGRFGRSFIGFEPTFRRLALGGAIDNSNGYPPYNLECLEKNVYRITLAVAGFTNDQLDITLADNKLTITGDNATQIEDDTRHFVHKGIAGRSFTRSFVLADHVSVLNAKLENGLLTVDLKQDIPEALKPRKIAISHNGIIDAQPVGSSVV